MSNSKHNSKKASFSSRLAPFIYKFVMVLITATCKIKIHGNRNIDQLKNSSEKNTWIYSIWHNNVLISPWALRNQNVTVMVSQSNDGEIIAKSVELFGNQTIRGSTSKNSAKVTRQAINVLRNNQPVAITPDGPRGPKYVLQEGVLYLAALSKTPIIPFHAECSEQWEFNSWDNLKLPKPFSTLHLCFGEAINIQTDALKTNKQLEVERVQQLMLDNVEFAKLQANNS